MKKKRSTPRTEVHSAPRKLNQQAPRRVNIFLPADLLLKLKMRAFEKQQTLTKYLRDLIINTMKE